LDARPGVAPAPALTGLLDRQSLAEMADKLARREEPSDVTDRGHERRGGLHVDAQATRAGLRRVFQTSADRTTALGPRLNHYNFSRPHGALSHKPPGSRLTNVARHYS